jgi:hypothetical protein
MLFNASRGLSPSR